VADLPAAIHGTIRQPFHQDAEGNWQRTESCVLGMGKLGGQELNYSSDVDVLFLRRGGEVFKESPAKKKAQRATMSTANFSTSSPKLSSPSFPRDAGRDVGSALICDCDPKVDAGRCAVRWKAMRIITRNGENLGADDAHQGAGVAGDESLAAEFPGNDPAFRFPPSLSADVSGKSPQSRTGSKRSGWCG